MLSSDHSSVHTINKTTTSPGPTGTARDGGDRGNSGGTHSPASLSTALSTLARAGSRASESGFSAAAPGSFGGDAAALQRTDSRTSEASAAYGSPPAAATRVGSRLQSPPLAVLEQAAPSPSHSGEATADNLQVWLVSLAGQQTDCHLPFGRVNVMNGHCQFEESTPSMIIEIKFSELAMGIA